MFVVISVETSAREGVERVAEIINSSSAMVGSKDSGARSLRYSGPWKAGENDGSSAGGPERERRRLAEEVEVFEKALVFKQSSSAMVGSAALESLSSGRSEY